MVKMVKQTKMVVKVADMPVNAGLTVLLVLVDPEVRKENRDEAVSRATGEYKVHLDTFS